MFSDMQLDSTKLGHTVKDRSAVMAKIIASLDEINFGVEDTKIDVLGKSKADFAFVQHMVYHMDEDDRAVVLLPHGVLFRGAAEEVIRKHLIQKMNVLDRCRNRVAENASSGSRLSLRSSLCSKSTGDCSA